MSAPRAYHTFTSRDDNPRLPKPRGRTTHPRDPVIVFARWAGYTGGHEHARPRARAIQHVYSAAIPPAQPLSVGTRIRILATSPAWYSNPQEDQEAYEAYDAHVVGQVTGIVGWKGRKVILEVENECSVNPVKLVRLRMPYAPEATVLLSAEDVPAGRREAHEADLNTTAVVRLRPEDPCCGAGACTLPWRQLVGEGFLWEPMEEEVGERPGIPGGRKKVPMLLVGWTDLGKAATRP
ncbi:hypothetical protein K466DRAFT_568035 [Polyporus arcularius HHB13444]|uniref:Uncharacterized protein n=1 Tax=Polyporus arcularius HHB13444 TaxID=1314778 RepID=A0A5C3P0S1_9APHY|nr:hypothetical protein K466DRAFT_568035 [Polyporus arcularius HHB13444]